ncbi:hypothetical protein DTO166G4_1773 [Paecilomyces variotii]|nr:hypothetical protein DTO166G4_1773 [Paecilomyces variotii]KAJ9239529.1 hypothetical protein DTO166G5_2276 [Paecilomyces variotii]KAJ9264537.1 hypothetical protein DTO195F2_2354 [Paecilomyces variotii]KAJ9366882.1 hypothetical protein DTO282E5_8438 [Paecilomyces variotii]
MSQQPASNVYAFTHSEAVLRTHQWRTVKNSAAYLLPYLRPNMAILDVGCGPGTLTTDLARHVPDGHVTGIETTDAPLGEARKFAEQAGVKNVSFTEGDVLNLENYKDETFDVVHAHQVLQHVPDPVKALSEMRRVTKKGGIVAARESADMTWYPRLKGLDDFFDVYMKVAKAKGGNPNPGSYIHVWAQEAGFARDDVTCTAGAWCFSSPQDRQYWGGAFSERVISPGYVENAVNGGVCKKDDLERISESWKEWARSKDGWFTVTHGEIICRK